MKVQTRKLLTLMIALCFSWVFIGALVNFHQVHVLGKNLPQASWTFVKPKSGDNQLKIDIDKSVKKVDADHFFAALVLESNTGYFSCMPCGIISTFERNDLYSADLARGPALRAPPVA